MFRILFSNIRKHSLHVLAGFAFISSLQAQTPTDGIMMEGKEICIAAIWSQDKWDEYWEGTLLRTNGNVGTFTKNAYSLMFAGGITDRINLLVSLPYMKTEATGGQLTGVQGIQDFGLWGKAVLYKKQLGPGSFTTQGVLGFTTPVTNYLPDYAPFSLGLGCTEGQGRVILQYLFDIGLYARVSGAYFLRGSSTIERDYYYTTTGIYSDKVDVPNANQIIANLGWWLFNDKLKLEAAYEKFNTLGGFDIRRQEPGFPSNNMESSAVNGHVQYYTPLRGLGFFGTYSQVLEGRNVGKATSIVAGVTYQF